MLNHGEVAFSDLTSVFLKLVKVEHIMTTIIMCIEYPSVETSAQLKERYICVNVCREPIDLAEYQNDAAFERLPKDN
jgi:hypothetical protein